MFKGWMGAAAGACLMLGAGASAKTTNAKVCSDLKQLNGAVTNLNNLTPQSTVAEFKQAANQVRDAGKHLSKDASADPQAKELDSAIKDLHSAANKVPANSTLADAKSAISDQLQAVRTQAQTFDQEHCQK
jgi:hypothetical protein